jgi:multidrug efflux pump subunit AcrB
MTDVRTPNDRRQRSAQPDGGRRGTLFARETEARPGIMTTEFWVTLLAAATVVIAGYVSDTFSNDLAWALFGGIVAAYVLSRGIAKAGSKEGPFIVRGGTAEQ